MSKRAEELARQMRNFIAVDVTDVLRPRIIFDDERATVLIDSELLKEREAAVERAVKCLGGYPSSDFTNSREQVRAAILEEPADA
jgi:hypothetical protein